MNLETDDESLAHLTGDGYYHCRIHDLPQIDQEYVTSHARSRGINDYDFTWDEYTRLRKLAEKMHLRDGLIQEFNKDYSFIHRLASSVRTGAINSITGMCYDVAFCNYALLARKIERMAEYVDAG